MVLFLYLWVYLKMSFRPTRKKFKQCSLEERTEWSFTSRLSEEFKMFRWNHWISWREELPFPREVQPGCLCPRVFLHILWCSPFFLPFVSSPPVGHSQHLCNKSALLSNPELITLLLLSVFIFQLYSRIFYCEKSCREN